MLRGTTLASSLSNIKMHSNLSTAAFAFLAISSLVCCSEKPQEQQAAEAEAEGGATSEPIIVKFSNFTSVKFEGFTESSILIEKDYVGLQRQPTVMASVTVNGQHHSITDLDQGNGQLAIDGTSIKGSQFLVTAPWQFETTSASFGSELRSALESLENSE